MKGPVQSRQARSGQRRPRGRTLTSQRCHADLGTQHGSSTLQATSAANSVTIYSAHLGQTLSQD